MFTVVLVSRSEGRGHRRVEAVLDRFARRVQERCWETPITQEGLDVLHAHLRSVATRKMAVSCYVRSPRGLVLRWSMGRPVPMNENGSVPVHLGRRKTRQPLPFWTRLACLLNEAAGLAHDFGKAGDAFQDKLLTAIQGGQNVADPVRHEWISMHMLRPFLAGMSWNDAWAQAEARVQTIDLSGTPFQKLVIAKPRRRQASVPVAAAPQATTPHMHDLISYLEFIVGSHHRLPQNLNDPSTGGPRKYSYDLNAPERAATYFRRSNGTPVVPGRLSYGHGGRKMPTVKLVQRFRTLVERAQNMVMNRIGPGTVPAPGSDFWLAMSFMARPAFILADHGQSSVDRSKVHRSLAQPRHETFANTARSARGSVLNQTLEWHLDAVGTHASSILQAFTTVDLPALPPSVVETLAEDTSSSRHQWQNVSARAVEQHRKTLNGPVLVLNMAGTGQGKTRMNMRLLAGLAGETPLRVATMLNLRSLTLQTFDAYEQQLGLGRDLLAGVIGDKVAQTLHRSTQQSPAKGSESGPLDLDDEGKPVDDVDGNPQDTAFESYGETHWDAPAWLEHALSNKSDMKKVILAPVAVCTTDFLVTAGDVPRQGNQALAFLRLATSDLILDEIDSYDPNALVAVMRMVMLAALCGRNVVASSATLSEPCAEGLWVAWRKGIALRQALLSADPFHAPENDLTVNVAMIDHLQTPVFLPATTPSFSNFQQQQQTFQATYRQFLDGMMNEVTKQVATNQGRAPRMATIVSIPLQQDANGRPLEDDVNQQAMFNTIHEQAIRLHRLHGHALPKVPGKTISFGLVRVANIRVAVQLARFLATSGAKLPDTTVRVACYHANLPRLRRHHIERRLDDLLRRDTPRFHEDPDLLTDVAASPHANVMFIVVATPVEEIGRDHDFDYGIIEPSSTQSIVQTAGRINRHRGVLLSEPNVVILNYNFRTILPKRGSGPKLCFCRPGLDDNPEDPFMKASSNLISVSMEQLLGHPVNTVWPLDARLKFERTSSGQLLARFSQMEEAALNKRLDPVRQIMHDEKHQSHFLQTGLYRFFLLRERDDGKEHLVVFVDTYSGSGERTVQRHTYDVSIKQEVSFPNEKVQQVARLSNDWLVLDDLDAIQLAHHLDISNKFGRSVSINIHATTNSPLSSIVWDNSFGMYKM